MYTELIKIIEGGLNSDSKKVISYAKHLAEKFKEEGNLKLYDRILATIKKNGGIPVYKDQLFETPVDNDSRLDIATILMPSEIELEITLSDSLKQSIDEFVKLAKSRSKIEKLGLDVNLSLLLYGPPGCGKTTIAKYVSRQLDLPLVIARFDALISSLLGSTAKNIRKLFDYARSKPCILFLDEFDAIAKARDDQHELGELKRVINSLLQNVDEFIESNILIAATNHEKLLDRAVWRRFEKIINVSKPEQSEIKDLIVFLLDKIEPKFSYDNKRLELLCSHLADFSHSEIKKVINSAVYNSIIHGSEMTFEKIAMELFRYKQNNSFSSEDAIKFLHENGVTQKSISDYLDISMRQVRNSLKLD